MCLTFKRQKSIHTDRNGRANITSRLTFDSPIAKDLTTCSSGLREKLADVQQVKKFPEFYGIQTFITAFKTASLLSLF